MNKSTKKNLPMIVVNPTPLVLHWLFDLASIKTSIWQVTKEKSQTLAAKH